MKIIGTGVDIVETSRIAGSIERHGERMLIAGSDVAHDEHAVRELLHLLLQVTSFLAGACWTLIAGF